MVRVVPHKKHFDELLKLEKIESKFFWSSFIFTVIIQIINMISKESFHLDRLSNGISICLLIILFVFDIKIDKYRQSAEKERKLDFIDNSLGSKYCVNTSENYYDNDDLDNGIYKLLINLYQNAFDTKNNLELMIRKSEKYSLLCFALLAVLAILGLFNSAIVVSILQLFLSKEILMKKFTLENYLKNVTEVYNEITTLLSCGLDIKKMKDINAKVIILLIKYESSIASSKIELDERIFKENNVKWEREWLEIKEKYCQK